MTEQAITAERSGSSAKAESAASGGDASNPRQGYSFASLNGREKIPLWLIVAVFAAVGAFIAWQFAEDWRPQWHRFRSIKLSRDGDFKGAIASLDALMKLPPKDKEPTSDNTKNPTYLSEMAFNYLNVDPKMAEKYARLAQENRSNMPPDDQGDARPAPDFSTMIGRSLYLQGDTSGSEQMFLAGLKHNKLDPFANYHLGEIEMKRGNYIKAGSYFKVVARDPMFEERVKEHYAEIEKKLFAGLDKK